MQYYSRTEYCQDEVYYQYYKKRKTRVRSLVCLSVGWCITLMMRISGVECFAFSRSSSGPVAIRRQKRRNELESSFVHTNDNKEQLAAAIQFNKEITCCESASDVLKLFVKVGGARPTSGTTFNSVNFSTMIHRIACKATDKRQTVTDPRLAILFCAIAENLVHDIELYSSLPKQNQKLFFKGRELSNIAWSMAKLQYLVPSKESLTITRYIPPSLDSNNSAGVTFSDPDVQWTNQLDRISNQLLSTSTLLRNQILQIAELKKNKVGSTNAPLLYSYIPTLRKLAGHILDAIAANVLCIQNSSTIKITAASVSSTTKKQQPIDCFNTQEFANLLWAFGTTKRGDVTLSEELVLRLMIRAQQTTQGNTNGDRRQVPAGGTSGQMKAQEVSNSVWALARMGARGPNQIRFQQYAASLLDNESFLQTFKTQELANTAWGAVTLLMKRSDVQQQLITDNNNNYMTNTDQQISSSLSPTGLENMEGDAEQYSVYRILKKVITILKHSNAQFRAQEVSITLWACATTRFGCSNNGVKQGEEEDCILMKETLLRVARNAVTRLREFQPQELNNLAWSYARLLYPITATPPSGEAEDEDDVSLKEAVIYLFRKIGDEILSRKDKFAPQDISTTLWSFATIGFSLELQQAMTNNSQTYPYEIPKLEEIYKTAAYRVHLAAHEFKPQELSNSVWALATAGIIPTNLDCFDTTFNDNISKKLLINDDPVTMCFGAVADELIKRPSEFKEQEIKDILWSFSKVGMRHPKLFFSVAEHLVGPVVAANTERTATVTAAKDTAVPRGFSTFTPQGFGNLAWSFAKQATISVENNETALGESSRNNSNNNGRLAVYETSCLDLGEGLVTKLFASIAEACIYQKNGLAVFKPQDISNVVWSFATLGLYHTSLLTVSSEELIKRVANCPVPAHRNASPFCAPDLAPIKPQEIANLMWSYATLNFRSPELVDALARYIVSSCQNRKGGVVNERSIATMYNRQELANIAWSCAVLERYPPELISLCYMGLLGKKNRKPNYIRTVMGDLGLQRQAIRSLLYVQLALDMEAPHLGLSLPDNFPNGFIEKAAEAGSTMSCSMFSDSTSSLNPSKTQVTISRALQRIGFDHVQEFVLDPPLDFLSIDIANPEKKLGVEVDGPSHYANVLDDVLSDNSQHEDSTDRFAFDLPYAPRSSVVQINNRKRMQFRWEWHGRRHENGPTALKHRILCHLGWVIAHAPFWEWNCVAGNIEDENCYLRELIKEISDPDEGDEIEI